MEEKKEWHDDKGRFAVGNPGGWGKGRTPSGRTQALNVLDGMLNDVKNLKILEADLLEKFKEDPALFFKTYVMPLIPRAVQLDVAGSIGLHPIQKELEKLSDKDLLAIAEMNIEDEKDGSNK